MPVWSATLPSTAAPRPPMPNANPKNTPEIIPKRCGINSCANTMIDERRDNEADEHRQHRAGMQAGIGQRQRERQRTEDREPDHVFTAEAIAQRATEEGPGRVRSEEHEQIELRGLGRDAELVDQVEY